MFNAPWSHGSQRHSPKAKETDYENLGKPMNTNKKTTAFEALK